MNELIYKQTAIDALEEDEGREFWDAVDRIIAADIIRGLPPAQPEYEPVKAEDFAKTMSESFMAWHSKALELMEKQGFVICKKRCL